MFGNLLVNVVYTIYNISMGYTIGNLYIFVENNLNRGILIHSNKAVFIKNRGVFNGKSRKI
jgi:hypothetical protein